MSISIAITGLCEWCRLLKDIRLYDLGEGKTIWLCKDCKKKANGESNA